MFVLFAKQKKKADNSIANYDSRDLAPAGRGKLTLGAFKQFKWLTDTFKFFTVFSRNWIM